MKFKFLNLICIFLLLMSFSGTVIASSAPVYPSAGIESITGFTEEYEALSDEEKQKIRDCENQWFENYTFNVTVTTIFRNDESVTKSNLPCHNLVIETIYESDEEKFKKEFGSDSISSSESYLVKQDIQTVFLAGEVIPLESLKSTNKLVFTETKQVILVPASTPHEWWNDGYAYPPYLYKKQYFGIFGDYTEREDPVNLVWKNTTASTARSTLISQTGWVALSDSILAEYPYAVYDRNGQWVTPLSVGETAQRRNGGYHVRIYQLSDGSVIGGAHKDSPIISSSGITHKVVDLEYAEYVVCNYFYHAGWQVRQNYINLYNSGTFGQGATNNGNATQITR